MTAPHIVRERLPKHPYTRDLPKVFPSHEEAQAWIERSVQGDARRWFAAVPA